jgi:hypothetical protein
MLHLRRKRLPNFIGVSFLFFNSVKGWSTLPCIVPQLSGSGDRCCRPQESRSYSATRLHLIQFPSSNNEPNKNMPTLPSDVKSAVSSCRTAVQQALQQRLSRMAVEFPVGTKFGVEKSSKKKSSEGPTRQDFQRSHRELARLFVDMFQPVGGENIAVAFSDAASADDAKKQWKDDSTVQCNVLSMDRKKNRALRKKQVSGKGFAAKLALEIMEDEDSVVSGPFQLPDNTEVALFVAPGTKELIFIEKVCEQVGMGTLVILLNARLGADTKFVSTAAEMLFLQDFEPVFSLGAAPQTEAPGCLLYRAFPSEWVLARKPKIGKPISILSTLKRTTPEECQRAYETAEISDVERGVGTVVDSISSWLK